MGKCSNVQETNCFLSRPLCLFFSSEIDSIVWYRNIAKKWIFPYFDNISEYFLFICLALMSGCFGCFSCFDCFGCFGGNLSMFVGMLTVYHATEWHYCSGAYSPNSISSNFADSLCFYSFLIRIFLSVLLFIFNRNIHYTHPDKHIQ